MQPDSRGTDGTRAQKRPGGLARLRTTHARQRQNRRKRIKSRCAHRTTHAFYLCLRLPCRGGSWLRGVVSAHASRVPHRQTGRYNTRYGFASGVLKPLKAYGLPLNETLLPQFLAAQGFVSHAVGKWCAFAHLCPLTLTASQPIATG